MPNWPLSREVRDDILGSMGRLVLIHTQLAEADCPLDYDDWQSMLMLKDDHLETVTRLRAEGVLVPTEWSPDLVLALPNRKVAVKLHGTPKTFFVPHTTTSVGSSYSYKLKSDGIGRLEALSTDKLAALQSWAEKAVKGYRYGCTALNTARYVLNRCETAGHLRATWPMLAGLVENAVWRERFHAPLRGLTRYALTFDDAMRRRMHWTEMLVTTTKLMGEQPKPPGLRPTITAWEVRPEEPKFTYVRDCDDV